MLDIDYTRTIDAFLKLGISEAPFLYSKSTQVDLFDELEKGNIPEEKFYSGFREITKCTSTDEEIRKAWNAILIGLREENVEFLKNLKRDHRLFLLSNTNAIHENAYRRMITEQYGYFVFDDLFEKVYLSHRLHMRKPDPAIFKHVLSDNGLEKTETCYIDDSFQHIEGANMVGMTAFLFEEKDLKSFFLKLVKKTSA